MKVGMLLACITAILAGCGGTLTWDANVQTFVDSGLSTVSMASYAIQNGGATVAVVPSSAETTVTLTMVNPESVDLTGTVQCADDTLFDSLPAVSTVSPQKIAFTFTPALAAEHNDLVFTVQWSAPSLNRTFDPEQITIPCNSRPGDVSSTIDAALDASGDAFVAFQLPSSSTDDDLSQVQISYRRTDGTGNSETVTLPVDDASLTSTILAVTGTNLLGTDSTLNRYYVPTDVSSGDDYTFTVIIIDDAGLESSSATTSSNATLYSVTYDGNGNTGGTAPVDSSTYRQTKSVTVLDAGTLTRTGYAFSGWNTAADGSGTSYAAGDTFTMGASDVTLYAQWTLNSGVTVTMTITNPSYGAITFSPSSASVVRGNTLVLTGSLSGATNWHWYIDDVLDTSQTSSTFHWDTSGVTPGQHIINVDAEYGGYPCTGSIPVTVTY